MKYDDASWHYGGEFPEESPPEYGATHIALFMRWCFCKGWAGELHLEEESESVKKVIEGSLSATKYFLSFCDEKLTDEDFSEEGNKFAREYYGDDGLYLDDYANSFGELMYVAPEAKHDFELFSTILETRHSSGILTNEHAKKNKPWWKF